MLLVSGCVAAVGILLIVFHPEYGGRAAFDAEFHVRPDGYKGLCRHYGFQFPKKPRQMDPGLMYKVLADGAVDVIDAFATDGRIVGYGLMVLEDDKGFFPRYDAAPLIRRETLSKYPELKDVLALLAGKISDEKMRELNYRVDEKGEKPSKVARDFLVGDLKLLSEDAEPRDGSRGRITIGGKHFTEQEILGQIMATLIECETSIQVTRKLNLGGTMVCFQALRAGDLDLYAEYTGTGLVNILKREVISDPDQSYEAVKRAFEQEYELTWLSPFGFNNTYALAMRRKHARQLGIKKVSDLADYLRAR